MDPRVAGPGLLIAASAALATAVILGLGGW